MIRIQLVHEGRVVKTISSRVHEAIVLEQVKRFADPVDEIRVVEGELSEAGKGILHHVAKKIVPAAMAAGMAMAAHGQNVGTPGQNRDFPGLDRSIGQHISDIFSPNYQERMRQRNYEMQTQQAEWTARQNELRQARIQQAREAGRAEAGASNVKVYDQARTSNDGKHFVIYGMDNTITRIPTQGTEFMPADSQRLAHYIAPNGQVYYVRHAAGTMTESVVREFAPNDGGNGGDDYLRTLASAWYNQDLSAIAHEVKKDKNPKKKGMMDRVIDAQVAVEKMLARGVVCGDGKVRKFSIDYNSDFDGVVMTYEDYAEYVDYGDDGEDIDSRTGKPWPNSKYDQIEFTDDQLDEGMMENRSSWDSNMQGWQSREQASMDAQRRSDLERERNVGIEHEDDPRWQAQNRPQSTPVLKGYYFYQVNPDDEYDAKAIGLKQTKSGKWALPVYNTSGRNTMMKKNTADSSFGQGRWWEPKK